MKTNVIFLICLMATIVVFGQNETKVIQPKFIANENVAAVLTNDNSFWVNKYLCENIVCPKLAVECQKEGTEIIQFTVTATGNVIDFKVINSVCPELDKEVIRVLKTTNGMWNPGIKDGEPIEMKNEVMFMFGDYYSKSIAEIFTHKATTAYKTGCIKLFDNNPQKALLHYNRAVNYLPNDKAILTLRGLCHYELGDKESARKDWTRLAYLGGIDLNKIAYKLNEMSGFTEITKTLAKK